MLIPSWNERAGEGIGYPHWMLISLLTVAAAPVQADDALAAALASYSASAHAPLPELSAVQLAALRAGEVVSLVTHDAERDRWRVVGMVSSSVPRVQLWMACVDPDGTLEARLSQARLRELGPGRYLWYGHLDLPAPFSDRHWALEIWNNDELAVKTDNRAWEHPWALRPAALDLAREAVAAGRVGALTPADFDAAIALPANDGGWAVIGVSDALSVVVHHADTQLGGVFPDRLVARYVHEGLDEVLEAVLSQAAAMPSHYTEGHTPILGGDNRPLPHF